MTVNSGQLAKQLQEIMASYRRLSESSHEADLRDLRAKDIHQFITQSMAAVARIAGKASPYARQVDDILNKSGWDCYKMMAIAGVVEALRHDVEVGYMQSAEELIHGELFSDFLEMAAHLLDEGYKDAAAVVCGASLEGHLRQLATKVGIETTIATASGVRSKKAETLNAEITKAGAYSVLDQKSVTAWLDLRNNAAHGQYDKYEKGQVSLMIAGVRDFMTRNPA